MLACRYDFTDIKRGCPTGANTSSLVGALKLAAPNTWGWWLQWPCQLWRPVMAHPKSFRYCCTSSSSGCFTAELLHQHPGVS